MVEKTDTQTDTQTTSPPTKGTATCRLRNRARTLQRIAADCIALNTQRLTDSPRRSALHGIAGSHKSLATIWRQCPVAVFVLNSFHKAVLCRSVSLSGRFPSSQRFTRNTLRLSGLSYWTSREAHCFCSGASRAMISKLHSPLEGWNYGRARRAAHFYSICLRLVYRGQTSRKPSIPKEARMDLGREAEAY